MIRKNLEESRCVIVVLVDHDIIALNSSVGLIDPFQAERVTNIGYDLSAEFFISDEEDREKRRHAALLPGESVFVGAKESIRLDLHKDLIARVSLKNSRLRQGLRLDAPIYQPGHHTRVFFRLTNVSGSRIDLAEGELYAMVVFDRLSSEPDHPYSGTFSGEFDFSGMGSYAGVYDRQIREIEQKTEDLKMMERSIYGNVLVIITVFVALFSFITTNFSLVTASATVKQFMVYNFLLLGCISFLVSLLGSFIGNTRSNRPCRLACILAFAIAIILYLV